MNSADGFMVKISAKSARLEFHGCEPKFIREVCHARCCDAPTRPQGTLITIGKEDRPAIEARGGQVVDGLLQTPDRVCPFKDGDSYLCALHGSGDKPFGCVASPFTLNANDTLIVRNRYKLLPCYKAGPRLPAYRAFASSLELLFGGPVVALLVDHLDIGRGDVMVPMLPESYRRLRENTKIHKGAP